MGRMTTIEKEKNQAVMTIDVVSSDFRGLAYLRSVAIVKKKVKTMHSARMAAVIVEHTSVSCKASAFS